jgi:endoglucanase
MTALELLERLANAHGPSGFERAVADIVRQIAGPMCDQVSADAMGNLVATKRGQPVSREAPHSLMLATHMDEIGLMVSQVEDGFIRFATIGGWDARVLPGQEVMVHSHGGLPGVIGARPPHVLTDDRRKAIPIDELFVDVGLPANEVAERVRVGDPITIRRNLLRLSGGRAAGKSLDNRASVAAGLRCLELLGSIRHQWDVHLVATVQEEIGLVGATTSAYALHPGAAIAVDVGHAQTPGSSSGPDAYQLGGGPMIAFGPNIHPVLHNRLVETADRLEIKHQIEPVAGPTGTDAWVIQVSRSGIPTALVSIPLRYMHTSVELADSQDIERTARLLANFAAGLDSETAAVLEGSLS